MADEFDVSGAAAVRDARRRRIDNLEYEVARLREEVRIDDELLKDHDRLLAAIPECKAHGACIPHAIEWVEKAKADVERLAAACRPFASWPIYEQDTDATPVAVRGVTGRICTGDIRRVIEALAAHEKPPALKAAPGAA